MKSKIMLFLAVASALCSAQNINADEVDLNELVPSAAVETDSYDSGEDNSESDIQDPEVIDYENEDHMQEDNSDNYTSDTVDGSLSDMVEMLRYDLVTYINFSYKMQICQAALLALVAGGLIAGGIFNHFTKG